jgi:hypothetical protein
MEWTEVRQAYPNEWPIIEALEAHTTPTHQRQLDKIAVVERCTDGSLAMLRYRHQHQQYPAREFYFIQTSREDIDIREQQWMGVRRGHAAVTEG